MPDNFAVLPVNHVLPICNFEPQLQIGTSMNIGHPARYSVAVDGPGISMELVSATPGELYLGLALRYG